MSGGLPMLALLLLVMLFCLRRIDSSWVSSSIEEPLKVLPIP